MTRFHTSKSSYIRAFLLRFRAQCVSSFIIEKERKGGRWMPRLKEAKKDVVSCEKVRRGANDP